MSAIKKSITLPKSLDSFVVKRAKAKAKARGETSINYSAVIADLIIDAKSKVQQPMKEAA